MKTFKKGMRLVSLLAAVTVAAGCFAGCGKTSDKDDQGRTIITVGGYPEKDGSDKDNFDLKISQFNEKYPEYVAQGDKWSFDRKSFYAKAAGGQLPVRFDAGFTEMSEVISAGYSSDITQALKNAGVYDQFSASALEAVSDDEGNVYAFPYAIYILGLAYNVSMFEEAGLMNADGTPQQPETWDEVVEFAVKIKEATGKAGFVFPTANNNGGWLFTNLAWSYGGNFMEKDSDGNWKAIFNSPECAEALQWIKDLKWKYDVLPANTFIDHTELYKTFAVGDAAMVISAGDSTRKVTAYEMDPEDFGLMAIPAGPKGRVSLMGGSVTMVRAGATDEQIDGAVKWDLLSYSPEITEEAKINQEKSIKTRLDTNECVTVKNMSVWNSDSSNVKYNHELIDKYANANPAHVKLYNDFVADPGDCELRAEEPVCCQELYGILDNCIQEVLTNKDADPAELLEKANSDFQKNYLDNI